MPILTFFSPATTVIIVELWRVSHAKCHPAPIPAVFDLTPSYLNDQTEVKKIRPVVKPQRQQFFYITRSFSTRFIGMDIDLFKTLISVSKHKSISKASEDLYLTQPAISKQIQALEKHYDIKLFERDKKKMLLTEPGKQLLDYAHRITSLYRESIRSLNERDGQVKGTLKMGANLTLGIYVLPRLIRLYSDIYPDLKIEMLLDNTDNIIKEVKSGDMNFGFIGVSLNDPLIRNHLFYRDRMKVVIGKNFGINKKTISWKDLEKLPFISRERGSDIRDSYEKWLKAKNIQLAARMELNNTEAIKNCVKFGIGFSILPWCTVENEIKEGTFRVLSPPYMGIAQDFYICHFKNKTFSKPEKVFLEFLFQVIEEGGNPFLQPVPAVPLRAL